MRRHPSLRSQLNQIRLWVRQGRTDAWIAHKLDVSIEQLARFKEDHDLNEGGGAPAAPADPLSVPPPEPEPEPEPEAEPEPAAEEPEELEPYEDEPRTSRPRLADRTRAAEAREERAEELADASAEGDGGTAAAGPRRARRRGRRGGRRRRGRPNSFEATFDHGEEGYGLWLDPAVVDNPVYAEHWAGHRAVRVTLDADAITIKRAGGPEGVEEESGEAE